MGFFWLQWVFVAVRRLSLVRKSGDYPLVAAVVASLVLVHRLLGVQASIAVYHGLWRRQWQPTPVLLPEFHGQRAWWATVQGIAKSLDTTVGLTFLSFSLHCKVDS